MELLGLPLTGTCDVSAIGRRSGEVRRIEIWYVVVDRQIVLTGTPGPRSWLANLLSSVLPTQRRDGKKRPAIDAW